MEYLIAILACLVTVSFLLKVGFFPIRILLAVACGYAVFTGWVTPKVTELSHDVFVQMTTTRGVLLDIAVCVILEAVVMIAFCFYSSKCQWVRRLLGFYPGLLFAAALCFFQVQLFYLLPGSDFCLTQWLSVFFVFLLVIGGSSFLRWALGDRTARKEMLFIVNLLIVILCVAITGY